ncbi:MAG TPA: pantetheine-phosphate adenylyltransferase [Miltoncostaeaceae bacterium]|jgi:pantetheine-phosphate adenylyltransferase|nr:pantetheine-phosphate adenylyltransferase [Miltoncostaeaceae bacterium]
MSRRTAICPGTYDPVTYGHLDIVERASRFFDEIIVSVTDGSFKKRPMFSTPERIDFVRRGVAHLPNVRVEPFNSLVTEHARAVGARVVVKGLRAISDFDYEFQMAQINRHLAAEVETVYLPASPRFSFISSSGVREVAAWGGDVDAWVPPHVADALRERFDQANRYPVRREPDPVPHGRGQSD